MKLQNLAIIFIIIILPISILLSEYMQTQIKTLSSQTDYDSKLATATYDAIKAFQLNTINSDTSDIADSKIRDIEASVNTFFNSISTALNVTGYTKEELKTYVPALVYTMYDGYYIYSPYKNTLTNNEAFDKDGNATTDPAANGEYLYGLKPYIYYSCRYKNGSSTDFIIYYSLDNYISIKGMINGKYVNDSGYLMDNIEVSGDNVTYRNIAIDVENLNREYLLEEDGTTVKLYNYIKVNGTKYYQDASAAGTAKEYFYCLNNDRIYNVTNEARNYFNQNKDDNAKRYYKDAKEFTDRVRNDYGLGSVDLANWAVQENGVTYTKQGTTFLKGEMGTSISSIEEEDSNFNQHRLEVIKNSITTNLTAAIASYNQELAGAMGNTETTFTMPKLQDDDWEKLLHEVCLISFMQGLSIGGKIYNGYSIITNSKTKEVVTEKSIFIAEKTEDSSHKYYRVGDKELAPSGTQINSSNYIGYLNIDFERKTKVINSQNTYYYPHKQQGSYTSIISSSGINLYENVYDYLIDKTNLAKVYYTALGRERNSMGRIK